MLSRLVHQPLRRIAREESLRQVVLGPAGLALGLAATALGAALPTGIMAYQAIMNEVDYTTISWVLIGPIWGLLAGFWILVRRWPMAAALPTGWLAIIAGLYFSDVYAQYPAALLFLLATAVVFLPDSEMPKVEAVTVSGRMPAQENG